MVQRIYTSGDVHCSPPVGRLDFSAKRLTEAAKVDTMGARAGAGPTTVIAAPPHTG